MATLQTAGSAFLDGLFRLKYLTDGPTGNLLGFSWVNGGGAGQITVVQDGLPDQTFAIAPGSTAQALLDSPVKSDPLANPCVFIQWSVD